MLRSDTTNNPRPLATMLEQIKREREAEQERAKKIVNRDRTRPRDTEDVTVGEAAKRLGESYGGSSSLADAIKQAKTGR